MIKLNNKAISTLLCALLIAGFISCKNNNNDPTEQDPCPCSDTCLLITDINNPPVITKPTCIKFDDAITNVPEKLYGACPGAPGNITGICGKNIDTIGYNAFSDNIIMSLCLPNIKHIGNFAFHNNKLTTLDLKSVEYIAGCAFQLNQLLTLNLQNIRYIGQSAFAVNQLTTINLGNVEYIGETAFGSNPDLIEVYIYTNPVLLELGTKIFIGNDNIIKIYIKEEKFKSAMEEKFKDCNVVVKVL